MKLLSLAPLGTREESLGHIGGDNLGPFGNIGNGAYEGLIGITKIVSSIIGMMTIAAAIWFVFQFMVGGFFWITAGGDKANLEKARHRISDAFIGLIIVVIGWAVLALAGQFLGIDTVIKDPKSIIDSLKIN